MGGKRILSTKMIVIGEEKQTLRVKFNFSNFK